tara:strand:+ start:126 stop:1217 length:1092 start_codon:yes stop_codon:yes gene_type:complete
MIRALSPYYIETPLERLDLATNTLVPCQKYTLTIQIWDGEQSAPNPTNEYKRTFVNVRQETGTHKMDISAMSQDFIEFNVPSTFATVSGTSVRMGNNQVWVYAYVTYNDFLGTKFYETTKLVSLGYTYGHQGENYEEVKDDFLLPVMDYKINRDGIFIIPFLADKFFDNDITISMDGGATAYTSTVAATTDSSEMVQYLWIDMTNDFLTANNYISVSWKGTTIDLDIYEEARYTPMDIMFQNKDGGLQSFTFFKDRKEETVVTDKMMETNRGQPFEGKHQFLRHNVKARNSVSASTGFIHERENEIVQQVLYARRTWIYDPVKELYRAVVVKDTGKKFKTQLTDRLINYTVKFEYGYDQINNN